MPALHLPIEEVEHERGDLVALVLQREVAAVEQVQFRVGQIAQVRSCVVVGPEGHSVDILAHEGLHAEMHYRVGHWPRLTQIPTWFDEGLAMQVDYRERYVWSPHFGAVNSGSVK